MPADVAKTRLKSREARQARVRKKVHGTAERPRLGVRRTLKNMIAQVIDDVNNKSLLQLTTNSKEFQGQFGELTKAEQARKLGSQIAEKAKAQGIEKVVFDRGGYIYHGRVQALAEGAREGGLQF
jgi:large subunit ribosomal protein L18